MSAPRLPPSTQGPNTTHALLAQHEPIVDAVRRGTISLLRPEVVEHTLLALHRELARLAALGEAPPARDAPAARDAVLIAVEARARGYRRTDSFRRWCQRHDVPLRLVGKRAWVRSADVDDALARAAAAPEARVVVGPSDSVPEPVAAGSDEVISRLARGKPRRTGQKRRS